MQRVTNHELMHALDKIIKSTMNKLNIQNWMQKKHDKIVKYLKQKNTNGYPLVFQELDSILPNWRSVEMTTATDPESYVYDEKLKYRVEVIFGIKHR